MSLIQMSQEFNERPSSLLGIEDEYTAYCLDEACAYIISNLREGKKPKFKSKKQKGKKDNLKNQRKLPSEIYKQYDVR